jgi:heme-degrading monooxygenase HmoA
MAYMYSVSFNIAPDMMDELEVGAALERVLGYLRALLPSEPGFTTVRALHSVDRDSGVGVLVESVWQTWDDLAGHRESSLSEDKVLKEFEPHVEIGDLDVRVYEEVD